MTVVGGHLQASKNLALLVSPEYEDANKYWFEPSFWGSKASSVSSGGRGSAWFIDAEHCQFVLRHYRRGGVVARFAERSYLFTGYSNARSLVEFRLLCQLKSLMLPVPAPVAALAWKHRLFWYRAAILVERIPGAVNLPDSSRLREKSLWIQLGQVIRRFHDSGLNHVDLNCDNILVAGDEIYLIDFDRCKLLPGKANRADSPWKYQNLERLHRSIRKRCVDLAPAEQEIMWQHMKQAYQSQPNHSK